MNLKCIFWTGATLLLIPVAAFAAPDEKSIPFDKTAGFKHADGTSPQRTGHNLLLHQRNKNNIAAMPRAKTTDLDNVVVIEDNGAILTPARAANIFDLSHTALRFTPGPDEFTVSAAGTAMDPDVGASLGLGDDSTTEILFPAGFPFLGETYTSIWVNSDGNITFGEGDGASTARDAARHVSGAPRVSALLVDLNVESGGTISADIRSDRLVVTWNNVPQYGQADSNSFQAVLHSDGTIDIVFGAVGATVGVVGVAEGENEMPFNEVDLSAAPPVTLAAGAIFEEFHPAHGTLLDILAVSNEFYKTHDDKYDMLVIFTDFIVDMGGAFAFYQPIQNLTYGLGFNARVFDNSAIAGSAGELEGLINMNRIGLYWSDAKKLVNPPIRKFRFSGGATTDGPPGSDQISRRARHFGTLNGDFGSGGRYTLGLNSAMSIMAQEAGHRWLAFPYFVHPDGFTGVNFSDLLGRSEAHWSFFFNVTVPPAQFGGDPRSSGAEGNAIIDLGEHPLCPAAGNHLFQTHPNELVDGFTKLDQYLMGLRAPGDVGSFWYINEPTLLSGNSVEGAKGSASEDDIPLCGKRVDLTVDNITAVNSLFGGGHFPENGVRFFLDRNNGFTPVYNRLGDEIDQDENGNDVRDVKTMAFILVTQQGSGTKKSAVMQVNTFRKTWQSYANGPATGGLGNFDTSLDPKTH